MAGHGRAFDRILSSLHEAALGATHWRNVSAPVDEACGITGTHLVIADQCRTNPEWLFDLFYYHGEQATDLACDYVDHFFPHDERVPRLVRRPDRCVVPMVELYFDAELKMSPTYNDLLRRTGARHGLNVRMDGPGSADIVWVTADPTSGDGWRSEQVRTFERLLPHVRQFVRVSQALAVAEARAASLTELLDNTLIGVLYLDRRGTIVEANDNARSILACRDGLTDQDGVLRARAAADDARLQTALARVLPGAGDGAVSGSISVRRGPLRPRIVLHVTPVRAGRLNFGACVPAALVLIVDPENTTSVDPALVASTYGLTHAARLVAAALAEGKTVSAIAAASGRQVSSVRWLVHQIHRKLGISRQADLVRMALAAARVPPSSSADST